VCYASKLHFDLGRAGDIIPWLTVFELGTRCSFKLLWYTTRWLIKPHGLEQRAVCLQLYAVHIQADKSTGLT
jgi:hypothetical protein